LRSAGTNEPFWTCAVTTAASFVDDGRSRRKCEESAPYPGFTYNHPAVVRMIIS
jgi:hypothetical protein